jgi:uncharacterized protein YfiM (DUF2279 family)
MLGLVERALSIGALSEELVGPSDAEVRGLMQKGTPLTFVAHGVKGNLAIAFTRECYLNGAGMKVKLEPYARSEKRQMFSFRFDDCIGAIASHGQYGMVIDAADCNASRGSPVYAFMFHGGANQQFVYQDMRLQCCANGQCITFDLETGSCFLDHPIESPPFVQKFAIVNRDDSWV